MRSACVGCTRQSAPPCSSKIGVRLQSCSIQPIGERASREELHHVERRVGVPADVEEVHHPALAHHFDELSDLPLQERPVQPLEAGEELDGDLTTGVLVGREPDFPVGARSELALHLVAGNFGTR